jgi:lipoprotein-releasing system ATP-binding protein
VFQFYHLLPEFDALENVFAACLHEGQDAQGERAGTPEGRRPGRQDAHRPGQLSGGEQQRVAIARSLVNDPELLLCDEPTGNLDTDTGKSIIDLLWELNKERKMTLIMVTHDTGIAGQARRVINIKDGKLTNN